MTRWYRKHSYRCGCLEHFEIDSCCRRLSTQIDCAARFFLFEIGAFSLSISHCQESITGHATMAFLFGLLVHVIACRFFSVFSFGWRTGAIVPSYLRLHLLITTVNTPIFRHKNFEQWTLLLFSWRYCLLACFVVGFCHSAMGHPLLIILFSNSASQASVIALLTTPSLVKLLFLRFSARVVPL